MKGQYVWLLDADSAMTFFDRCLQKEAITEDEKAEVMMQMYREGLIECMGHTTLTKDELAEALAKEIGIRVLKIGKENSDEKD